MGETPALRPESEAGMQNPRKCPGCDSDIPKCMPDYFHCAACIEKAMATTTAADWDRELGAIFKNVLEKREPE